MRDRGKHLPGQGCSLHACSAYASPSHSLPPNIASWILILTIGWVPPPHSAEQTSYSQSPHTQSTKRGKNQVNVYETILETLSLYSNTFCWLILCYLGILEHCNFLQAMLVLDILLLRVVLLPFLFLCLFSYLLHILCRTLQSPNRPIHNELRKKSCLKLPKYWKENNL